MVLNSGVLQPTGHNVQSHRITLVRKKVPLGLWDITLCKAVYILQHSYQSFVVHVNCSEEEGSKLFRHIGTDTIRYDI
jgi:hypothetical protein